MKTMRTDPTDIRQLLAEANDNVRKIIHKILELEAERLYENRPRLVDDIVRIIEEEIK